MNSKPLAVVVGLVAAFAGAFVARKAFQHFRREPTVARDILTRPWVKQQIGQSGVGLETPWRLEGLSMPLPKELSGLVSEWTWIGHEADGLNIMAARVRYAPQVVTSLEGAAQGALKNLRAMPGILKVTPQEYDTTLLGQPAIELDARLERKTGEPLRVHAIFGMRGPDLFQVLLISRADQPLGEKVWDKTRATIRLRE